MKTLSLWQPWASLVALGIKTIETRSWSTKYRGPLAIHAARRRPDHFAIGEWVSDPKYRPGAYGPPEPHIWRPTTKPGDLFASHESRPMPLGCVIATCTLADVVPIVGPEVNPFEHYPCIQTDVGDGDFPDGWLDLFHPTLGNPIDPERSGLSVPDQAPYGDYEPGRYAWLLADIARLSEPVPARGRQQLWEWRPEDG